MMGRWEYQWHDAPEAITVYPQNTFYPLQYPGLHASVTIIPRRFDATLYHIKSTYVPLKLELDRAGDVIHQTWEGSSSGLIPE